MAVDVRGQGRDIWIWDFARETLTRFTFDPGQTVIPVWTPDGQRLLFRSAAKWARQSLLAGRGRHGAVERLTESPNEQSLYAFAPDGTRLVFREDVATTGQDLMVLALQGGGGPSRSCRRRSMNAMAKSRRTGVGWRMSPMNRGRGDLRAAVS